MVCIPFAWYAGSRFHSSKLLADPQVCHCPRGYQSWQVGVLNLSLRMQTRLNRRQLSRITKLPLGRAWRKQSVGHEHSLVHLQIFELLERLIWCLCLGWCRTRCCTWHCWCSALCSGPTNCAVRPRSWVARQFRWLFAIRFSNRFHQKGMGQSIWFLSRVELPRLDSLAVGSRALSWQTVRYWSPECPALSGWRWGRTKSRSRSQTRCWTCGSLSTDLTPFLELRMEERPGLSWLVHSQTDWEIRWWPRWWSRSYWCWYPHTEVFCD